MLRISKLTDYAIVLLSFMARHPGGVCAAAELAQATGIAPPTVSKVLKLLSKEHIVRSTRGAKGGYALTLPPERTTVASIISALEGPIAMTECNLTDDTCRQASCCNVRGNWGLINRAVKTALESVTLQDMALPVSASSGEVMEVKIAVDSLCSHQRRQ